MRARRAEDRDALRDRREVVESLDELPHDAHHAPGVLPREVGRVRRRPLEELLVLGDRHAERADVVVDLAHARPRDASPIPVTAACARREVSLLGALPQPLPRVEPPRRPAAPNWRACPTPSAAGCWRADRSRRRRPVPCGLRIRRLSSVMAWRVSLGHPGCNLHCWLDMSVIVLLADGARADTLAAALDSGALPALARLRARGRPFTRSRSTFPSVTGPAYTPFLMGRFPGSVGLPGLRWFDRSREACTFPDYSRSYVGLPDARGRSRHRSRRPHHLRARARERRRAERDHARPPAPPAAGVAHAALRMAGRTHALSRRRRRLARTWIATSPNRSCERVRAERRAVRLRRVHRRRQDVARARARQRRRDRGAPHRGRHGGRHRRRAATPRRRPRTSGSRAITATPASRTTRTSPA